MCHKFEDELLIDTENGKKDDTRKNLLSKQSMMELLRVMRANVKDAEDASKGDDTECSI